jgi:hypothetical protein
VNQPATISIIRHYYSKSYLYWSIPFAGDLQPDPLSPFIERNLPLDAHHCPRHFGSVVLLLIRKGKDALIWDREEAAIESFGDVAVVCVYGVVDSNEKAPGGECPLDHDLSQGGADRWQDMPTPQHCRSNRHEICHGVVAIANQLRSRG